MLSSSILFYHYWRKLIVSKNGKDGTAHTCLPEMQKVFSNCSMEGDGQIRSSNFIEAITSAYNLNEELTTKLEAKLDPDNLDLLYSKDELFIIFKDWIMSAENSPECLNSCFSVIKFPQSTPANYGGSRRRMPRMRLFLPDGAQFGSDEVDIDTSRSSSSTKKRLSHHRSILESKLETFEKHASSLEKKYEDACCLCAQQKLEIERLKQELKTHHETEQAMEEMSEERRKLELETERKYSRVQGELSAALTERTNLITELALLKQESSALIEKMKVYEKESAIEREKKSKTQLELEGLCAELKNEIYILNNQKAEQDAAFAIMMEENSILTNDNNDLRSKITSCSPPTALSAGVPLCEELPSEMFQFILEDTKLHACGLSMERMNYLPELISRSCQTENEIQLDLSESESIIPSTLFDYEELIEEHCNIYSEPDCSQTHSNSLVQSQHDVHCVQMENRLSQTVLSLCGSSSQADNFAVCVYCQTDAVEINSSSSQTEPFMMISTYSQTNPKRTTSSLVQTVLTAQTQENIAQTDRIEVLTDSSQTDIFVSASSCTQTEIFEMVSVANQTVNPSVNLNWSQTLDSSTVSTYCQTELLVETSAQQMDPIDTDFNSSQAEAFSEISHTEQLTEISSISTQTGSPSSFFHTERSPSWFQRIFGILYFFWYLPEKIVRCFWFFFCNIMFQSCNQIVAFGFLYFVYIIVCQNNKCMLEFKYPSGRPPPV